VLLLVEIIGRALGRTTNDLLLICAWFSGIEALSSSSLGIVQTAPTPTPTPTLPKGFLSYTMKRFTSIRKEKRKSADLRKSAVMASPQESAAPSRQETMASMASIASDEAVPDTDPSTVRVASRWKYFNIKY
jgi:hypothetical protein